MAEASTVVFLEPDYQTDIITQEFARYWQQKNKNKSVESILLLVQNNIIEDKIMKVNKLYKGIQKAATKKVTEDLPNVNIKKAETRTDLYKA